MEDDFCETCIFNTEHGGWNCLFAGAGIRKVTCEEPCKTLACEDYVCGDSLPADIPAELIEAIHSSLFWDCHGIHPSDNFEQQKLRYIYRITFSVDSPEGLMIFHRDIGACGTRHAIEIGKLMWQLAKCGSFLEVNAHQINACRYRDFTHVKTEVRSPTAQDRLLHLARINMN